MSKTPTREIHLFDGDKVFIARRISRPGEACGDLNVLYELEEFGVLFIDTEMGLYVKNETIGGILRVTTSESSNRAAARARMSFASGDDRNEYDKNVQIADLNALNAVFAVARWKKLRSF